MSFLFGSTTIPGNRLTDLVGQTSTVGTGIPFGYGLVKVSEPNVIWTAGIPKEHVKKKKQGKGGVKTTEYTYTLSYAIAFMAGPAFGFVTIKRAGKVVYTTDPNASVEDKAFAAKWLQRAKLYLGTEEQMPDATIESYKGAGKVSAFRGLVYIVVKDDDVTNEGGSVPQYEAVIIASGTSYATSPPYVLEDIVDVSIIPPTVPKVANISTPSSTEAVSTFASAIEIENRLMQTQHSTDPEAIGVLASAISIESKQMQTRFTAQPEKFDISAGAIGIENIQIRVVLDKSQISNIESTAKAVSIEVIVP